MAISKLPTSASLKEVMDKFEEISLQDFSSIDIIVVNELPIKVKNGQLCILKDNFAGHIYMANEKPSYMKEGDIFIKINNDIAGAKEFSVKDSNASIKLIIRNVRILKGGVLVPVTAYLGENGVWNLLENMKCVVFNKGVFDDLTGGGMDYQVVSKDTNASVSHTIGETIVLTQSAKGLLNGNPSTGKNQLTTKAMIDLAPFKYLHIDISAETGYYATDYTTTLDCQVQIVNSKGTVIAKYAPEYINVDSTTYEISRRTYKLNVEKVSEPCYIRVYGAYGCVGSRVIENTITVYSLVLGGEVIDN